MMQLRTIASVKVLDPHPGAMSSRMPSSFLYALIFFFIFLLITLVIPPRSNSSGYFGALRDKHHRLNALPSPKIVFIGGSNLAFGLDSSLIEKTFNRPVVNMGLCAPFGLRYILEEIKDHINSGDTIVIVPEYGILQNSVDGSTDMIHALEVYPLSALFILKACITSPEYIYSLANIALNVPASKWNAFYLILNKMLKKGYFDPNLLNNWEVADPLGPCVRYYFEQHGDYFGHFIRPNRPYRQNWELVKSMSFEAAHILNDFDKFAHQRGAQVVIIPAPIPSEYLAPNMCSTKVVSNWPDKKITIPVLADPKRYSFTASYFYEAPYHLNLAGRKKRTTLIIEDLESFLNKNKNKNKIQATQTY
jgi:hypothetical protein